MTTNSTTNAASNQPLEPCPTLKYPLRVEPEPGYEGVACILDSNSVLVAAMLHPQHAEQIVAILNRSRVSDGGVVATVDEPDKDLLWERQSTINSIAYEFMKLFGATAKDGWTHDEMQPVFDAAREIITRTFPVLAELHAASPAAPQQSDESKLALQAKYDEGWFDAIAAIRTFGLEQVEGMESATASPAAPKEEAPTCWHCGVVLAYAPKLRCEDCSDECDVEGCDELGCSAVTNATQRRICSKCGADLGFSEANPCDRCT